MKRHRSPALILGLSLVGLLSLGCHHDEDAASSAAPPDAVLPTVVSTPSPIVEAKTRPVAEPTPAAETPPVFRGDQGVTEKIKETPEKTEPTKAEPTRTEPPIKAQEPARPKPARRIVTKKPAPETAPKPADTESSSATIKGTENTAQGVLGGK